MSGHHAAAFFVIGGLVTIAVTALTAGRLTTRRPRQERIAELEARYANSPAVLWPSGCRRGTPATARRSEVASE